MVGKKILLIIPNLTSGGAERSFSKLSLELAKKHEVFVCVFNTYEGIGYPYGGTLLDLNIAGANSVSGKILNFWQRVRLVKAIKQKYRIEVSISFLEGADYVNILSKGKEKVIISIRGSKTFDAEIAGVVGDIRKKVLIPYLYKKADRIIAVSEGIRQELIQDFNLDPHRITTIYNFYETTKIIKDSREDLEVGYQKIFAGPVIINSGRLHVQKEQAGLIEVFAQTKVKETARLVIIGDGGLLPMLKEKAKTAGLSVYAYDENQFLDDHYQVYFLGHQTNPFKFIRQAELFAFTSSWEGFPNALAEAMVVGVPVITTDCPTGPREILAPGSPLHYSLEKPEFTPMGVLMPLLVGAGQRKAIREWAETIDYIFSDKRYRETSAQNAQLHMENFTPAQIFQEWEQVIHDR